MHSFLIFIGIFFFINVQKAAQNFLPSENIHDYNAVSFLITSIANCNISSIQYFVNTYQDSIQARDILGPSAEKILFYAHDFGFRIATSSHYRETIHALFSDISFRSACTDSLEILADFCRAQNRVADPFYNSLLALIKQQNQLNNGTFQEIELFNRPITISAVLTTFFEKLYHPKKVKVFFDNFQVREVRLE